MTIAESIYEILVQSKRQAKSIARNGYFTTIFSFNPQNNHIAHYISLLNKKRQLINDYLIPVEIDFAQSGRALRETAEAIGVMIEEIRKLVPLRRSHILDTFPVTTGFLADGCWYCGKMKRCSAIIRASRLDYEYGKKVRLEQGELVRIIDRDQWRTLRLENENLVVVDKGWTGIRFCHESLALEYGHG